MATTAQITANRIAAVAKLPLRAPEAQVAHVPTRHAVRHNLSPGATFTLLPGEDVSAFEQLVREYREEFKPRTAHEIFLVNQMVQAQWRMSRLERLQAEVLDRILNVPAADGKTDEGAIVAAMGFSQGATLDRLERYGRAAERAYFRANKELKQYRAAKQNEAKTAAVATPHSSLPAYELMRRDSLEFADALATAQSNKTNPTVISYTAGVQKGHLPLDLCATAAKSIPNVASNDGGPSNGSIVT